MDAFDCDGVALDGYGTYAKVNGFTRYSYANSGSVGFGDYECQLNMNPNIVISVASQNPRKYSQVDYSFTGGPLSTTELTLCEDDDTFIKYSIDGGDMIEANIFTYANLFPNGVMVLKQVDPVYAGGTDISFDITGYSVGGNSYGYVYFISYLSNAANNLSSSENLDVTITFRDDKFIEGTFGGSLSDVFENPLGILEGSFRARIQ